MSSAYVHMLQVHMVRNPSTNDGLTKVGVNALAGGKLPPLIKMSMREKSRDANSAFIPWCGSQNSKIYHAYENHPQDC